MVNDGEGSWAGSGTAVAIPEPQAVLTPHARWAKTLAYLYLLRVPVIVAAVLFFFPIFALRSSLGQPIFQNFFYMDPWASAVTTVVALMVTWSVVLNALVVLFNASERFAVASVLTQEQVQSHRRLTHAMIGLATIILAAPTLTGQFLQKDWGVPHVWWNAAAVTSGAVVAYLLAFAALWVALWLMPSTVAIGIEIFPAPATLRKWLADRHQSPCAAPQRFLRWLGLGAVRRLRKDFIAGFIDDRPTIGREDNPAYGMPWSGVLLSVTFAAVTFVVYSAIGIVNAMYATENTWSGTGIPALAYVLLLLLNAGWILSLSAYFWDRFRIPLLALLIVAAFAGEYFTDFAEHYYRLSRRAASAPGQSAAGMGGSALLSPAAVLRGRMRQDKPVIVVATMGGGIQAAAWTVRVLTGLETQIQAELGPDRLQGRGFADSIAMISSVSGGATGSLFFLNQYRKEGSRRGSGFAPTAAQCARFTLEGRCEDFSPLLEEAFRPRLDDVAWALVYRDLPRILFPYLPGSYGLLLPIGIPEGRFLDRGRMLELSWQRSGIHGRLSDWYEGLQEGWRPASVFNATVAETGEPFLFSTTSLKSIGSDEQSDGLDPNRRRTDTSWRSPRPTTFADFYRESDIDLVTAARLASGFPYVLPIPRAYYADDPGGASNDDIALKYHLIDGGYYDNYGVDSAVQWIDQGLRELEASGDRLPSKVLVLQIRAFPDIKLPDVQNPPKEDDAFYTRALPRNRGWVFELFSPISGLLHVRSSGQLLHNRNALLLLRAKWRAATDDGVDIRFATFEFPGRSAPLSFKMNPTQRDNILKQWDEYVRDDQQRVHIEQVNCMFDDTRPRCREARVKAPE
jgi:hypothetical protein